MEKAKQLVQAAGYDGSELTLFATARTSDIKRGVELLQADWARIGVKVRVQLMELGELYKRTGKGEHDLALLSWFSVLAAASAVLQLVQSRMTMPPSTVSTCPVM